MYTICLRNIFYSGKNHEYAKAAISHLRLQGHRTALKGVHIIISGSQVYASEFPATEESAGATRSKCAFPMEFASWEARLAQIWAFGALACGLGKVTLEHRNFAGPDSTKKCFLGFLTVKAISGEKASFSQSQLISCLFGKGSPDAKTT